ncbi:glycosyltransferase family 8 protein [Hypoxylon sp. FL0543]|nr:glycosyltransferase family 8 protein [Hypoxylon sp. FL0543]
MATANGVKNGDGEDDGWYDPTKIWTTLLTNRGYFGGLLVLHHSLRRHRSKYRLVVMVTRAVEEDAEYMGAFAAAGIPTIVVDKIEPAPRDGKVNKGTWEKLAPWSFTQYERVVLLDSDQVILQNIDDMMEVELPDGWIASTHACTCNPRKLPHYSKDWVPANCAFTAADQATGEPAPITPESPNNHHLLNSGTVILRPSREQYEALIHAMNTHPDVPDMLFFDQDLLAIVYRGRWKPLPYHYNALKPMRACHRGLWRDEHVKILHYILNKPWKSRKFDESDTIESTHRLWWDEFALVEREWVDSADERKRELWRNVVVPVVAQE